MTTWYLGSSSALSASTGAWLRSEAQAFYRLHNQYSNDTLPTSGATITQAVTFANAGNQRKLMLYLVSNNLPVAGATLTIKLQEYVTGAWTDRTTDNFTIAQQDTNVWGTGARHHIKAFSLTSYAVTTAASTWRYVFTATTTQGNLYLRRENAGQYMYAAILDTAGTPASGDTWIVGDGVTLTIDQSCSTGVVANSIGNVFCETSNLAYTTSPGGAYTWTILGGNYLSPTTTVNLGTSGNRIPAASALTIDNTGSAAGFALFYVTSAYTNDNQNDIRLYGEYSANPVTKLAASANSGQAVIVTTDDMSAVWSNGDLLHMNNGEGDITSGFTYTISTIVGTTITFTGNLSFKHVAGAQVINLTHGTGSRYGIKITSATTRNIAIVNGIDLGCVWKLTVNGAYLKDISAKYLNSFNRSLYLSYITFENVMIHSTQSGYSGITFSTNTTGVNTMTILLNKVYTVMAQSNPGSVFQFTNALKLTITDCALAWNYNELAGKLTGISDVTATNTYFYNCNGRKTGTLYPNLGLFAVNAATFTNCNFHGGAYVYLNGALVTFTNCTFGWMQYGIRPAGLVLCTFTGCDLFTVSLCAESDVSCLTSTFNQVLFANCKATTTALVGVSSMISGSWLRYDTWNQAANTHTGHEKNGLHVSCGTGLSDTTVHTAGGFSMRRQPTSSTLLDSWVFAVPTGNIQNKTMMIGCWIKINNAGYYAGTHQLPSLNVNYDNGTTVYAQAAAQTGWQFVYIAFTPTSTYGQVIVTIDAKTDATSSNAYYYIDDFAVLYPAGYQLALGSLDLWGNALPIVPPISTNLSALDVWTTASTISYGSNTMGETLKAASAPSAAAVADAVWDEAMSGHVGAGSTGEKLNSASAPSAATVASAVRTELATELGRVDATVSSRNAAAPLDAAGTRAAVGLATANLDTQLTAIDDFLDTEVAAIKAKTDNLPASPAATGDIPSASAMADAVWNEANADHLGEGSVGAKMNKLRNASLLVDGEIIV